MRTLHTVSEVREHVRRARATEREREIALVPTMGAFHGGHEALMRTAVATGAEVIVSLFVNPAQFEDQGDLGAYPRDESRDAAIAARLGVDALFAPAIDAVYPDGFATRVTVGGGLGDVLEGVRRGRGHFEGVVTVVAKLFNIVTPDVAYFGQKDAQQVVLLRRMAHDLDVPVRIEVVPTVREPDGLALSSRNARLAPADRARAVALSRALEAAEAAAHAGARRPADVRAAALAAMEPFGVAPEYLAVVDPETLAPLSTLNGRALVAVAAQVGSTHLIDNTLIDTSTHRRVA